MGKNIGYGQYKYHGHTVEYNVAIKWIGDNYTKQQGESLNVIQSMGPETKNTLCMIPLT